MIITIKNLQKKILVPKQKIKKLILKVLRAEKARGSKGMLNLFFVDDAAMRKLNQKYLNQSCSTDVLAFDLSRVGHPRESGNPELEKITNKNPWIARSSLAMTVLEHLVADIIICADTAKKNSKTYKTSTNFELQLYAAHGVLHLLGYNDHTKAEVKIMRKKEREYVY